MSDLTEKHIPLGNLVWDTDSVQPGKVVVIAASFRETNTQINAIQVRPQGKAKFVVVAGRHRCEAAKAEGWTKIRALILPYATKHERLQAELIEIDENLCRNSQTPASEAALIARRKAVYEQLHPETAHGGKRANKAASRQLGDLNGGSESARMGASPCGPRFSELTAKASGKSERSVQRAAQRGAELGADTLEKLSGTSLDKGEELDALIALPEPKRAEIVKRAIAGEKVSAKVVAKQEHRAKREASLGAKIAALPDKKYGLIAADPEWERITRSEAGKSRDPSNHYPTSSDEVIASRPVASIAAPDCVLALWCTDPHRGVDLMRAWGFEPKSYFTWVKGVEELEIRNDELHGVLAVNALGLQGKRLLVVVQPPGTGYWNRDRDELLLIGTRGSPVCPAMGLQGESAWFSRRGEHSAKPDVFYEWIEKHFPNTPKIELNARGPGRPGWDVWGNEAIAESAPSPSSREARAKPDQPAQNAEQSSAEGMSGAPGVAAAPSRDGAASFLPPPKVAGIRTPSGKTVHELIERGDIIRTKSGRGPYVVEAVTGAKPSRFSGGHATFALALVDATAPKRGTRLKPSSWISELVAVDGRILKLFETDDEEVFVDRPPAQQPEPPKPAAPTTRPGIARAAAIDTKIPAHLKRPVPKRSVPAERRS